MPTDLGFRNIVDLEEQFSATLGKPTGALHLRGYRDRVDKYDLSKKTGVGKVRRNTRRKSKSSIEQFDYRLGDKVVYPQQGVGIVERISYGCLNRRSERYLTVRIISSGLRVMIAQTDLKSLGLRRVIRSNEARQVLSFLEKGRSAAHHDWKYRFKDNSERMRRGSPMEVAAVLKELLSLSLKKPLSFREKKMLERARHLLISELATVRNTTEQTMETDLVRALAKARLQMPETVA